MNRVSTDIFDHIVGFVSSKDQFPRSLSLTCKSLNAALQERREKVLAENCILKFVFNVDDKPIFIPFSLKLKSRFLTEAQVQVLDPIFESSSFSTKSSLTLLFQNQEFGPYEGTYVWGSATIAFDFNVQIYDGDLDHSVKQKTSYVKLQRLQNSNL